MDPGENGSNGQDVPRTVEGVSTEPGSVTSPGLKMAARNALEKIQTIDPVVIVKVGKYHNLLADISTKRAEFSVSQ